MLITDANMLIDESVEVPVGTIWRDCKVRVSPGVRLTVNGLVADCLFTLADETFEVDGHGEFSNNYLHRED